MICRAKRS